LKGESTENDDRNVHRYNTTKKHQGQDWVGKGVHGGVVPGKRGKKEGGVVTKKFRRPQWGGEPKKKWKRVARIHFVNRPMAKTGRGKNPGRRRNKRKVCGATHFAGEKKPRGRSNKKGRKKQN